MDRDEPRWLGVRVRGGARGRHVDWLRGLRLQQDDHIARREHRRRVLYEDVADGNQGEARDRDRVSGPGGGLRESQVRQQVRKQLKSSK